MTIATGVDPAFSQFYVAKEGGLFEKNGLDVTINTGPSGSAMVPFLINNQVHAAYGSDLAGVINHNVDNNIVAVADGTYLVKWMSVVGRNVPDMARPQGQARRRGQGTGGEIFWNRVRREAQAQCGRLQDHRRRGAGDGGRHRARRHRRLRCLGAVAVTRAAADGQGAPRSCRTPRASTTTSTSST